MAKILISIMLVIFSFLVCAVFFRVISGGEDDWIADGKGGWVKHGVPAGPMPDYPSKNTPVLVMFIPLIVLGTLVSCLSLYIYNRKFCKK